MADAALSPIAERAQIANQLVALAPPGTTTELVHDIETLLDAPTELASHGGLARGLQHHHEDQCSTVRVLEGDAPLAVICAAAALQNETKELEEDAMDTDASPKGDETHARYRDPRAGKAFSVDLRTLAVSNIEDLAPLDADAEAMRKQLEGALDAYVAGRYPHGACAVFAGGAQGDGFHMVITDAKFNADNFWNGRWRSYWRWHGGKLVGAVRAAVHYYEDGNVQLHTEHKGEVELADSSDAASVIKALTKLENERHRAILEAYADMADNAFRTLRRALPLTKTKVDWHKIANYKVGAELTGSAAAARS